MGNVFIEKIRQIILEHLDDEKFGVSQLASEIGLSKSQTFRKVKTLSNKSINQLIREIRLQEAAKLIQETDLLISEISYKVGFSSPSYFIKCFSKYYGVTPGEFNENLQIIDIDQDSNKPKSNKKQFILYLFGAVVLLLGIIRIINGNNNITNSNTEQISIAVLYFDDHSPNSDKEWFCNAITEEIRTKLSGIKGLNVTSRTSVKQYRNSTQSIPEIAKGLMVDYIIEGSVTMDENIVKITVQLVMANNNHKWSKEYAEGFEKYFDIQQKVAEGITEKLKIDLSLEDEKWIDYVSTKNIEAFQLFSEARSFADLAGIDYLERVPILLPGGFKNLKISDSLFQKAIELDPNYAEAFAERANSLHLMWGDIKTIDSLLDKSIEINPNIVRAYTTRGAIMGSRKGNWKKAKTYFEKAFNIMPNDATNQLYFALYYANKPEPDYNKALEYINTAQKLNPRSYQINYNKIKYLLNLDKIIEAEEFYKSNKDFFPENLKIKIQTSVIKAKAKKLSLENNDWKFAIDYYHNLIQKDSQNAEIHRLLAEAYDEILNDAPNFYRYAKLAYELDSLLAFQLKTDEQYIFKRTFMFSQGKNKKWEENYKMILGTGREAPFFTYYYMQGDYEKAELILKEYPFSKNDSQATLFASQGRINDTYSILNKDVLANYEKARVFAILEERDSMYYYINKETDIYNIRYFNSYFEVDSYRKEERFKALLKKHNLPITHWNE